MQDPKTPKKPITKEERLAAALRANLKRRKQQQRDRAEDKKEERPTFEKVSPENSETADEKGKAWIF
tara:strand:+ start:108 stop:308 length:201 start_codon:yes stop_codon:yes gene_type:complete